MAFKPTQFDNDSQLVPIPVCCGGTGITTAPAAIAVDPVVLYKCIGWTTGSVQIPTASLGSYARYEIVGQVACWQYYCSGLTFGFNTNFNQYCCAHASCSAFQPKTYPSTPTAASAFSCAGMIHAAFGISSDQCTACSINGWMFKIELVPGGCGGGGGYAATYAVETTLNGSSNTCQGTRNSGFINACCASDTSCLKGICMTTPGGSWGGSDNALCRQAVTVTGYGRLV